MAKHTPPAAPKPPAAHDPAAPAAGVPPAEISSSAPPAEAPAAPTPPPAPARRGAMPLLRAHGPWVDHFGLGVRVEAGEVLDWSDPAAQRLFRQCLNWSAFTVEFAEIPASKAEAVTELANAMARIAELEGLAKVQKTRMEGIEDAAAEAVAAQMAELSEHVASLQAQLDERTKQLEEVTGKLQAAIAGERPEA